MKKTISLRMNRPGASTLSRRFKQSVSAAMLASAMMAGSSLNAADLTVNGDSPNLAERVVTINPDAPLSADSVFLINDGQIVGAGTLTASVIYELSDGVVSANLAGDVALEKITTGTVTLSGSNSYTGNTNILGGTLEIGDGLSGSINAASDVYIGVDGRLALNLANGSTFANNVEIVLDGPNWGNYVVTSSGTTTISGVISGGGGFFIHDGGTGTGYTILTGENTSTGAYGVESGILQIGDGTSGSISASSMYAHSTGVVLINLVDGGYFNTDIGSDGIVGFIANGTNTISSVISGTGYVAQAGTGLTILTGANTYTGATYVYSGTLQIGDGVTSGASIASSSSVEVSSGATLAVQLADGETFSNAVETNGTVLSYVDGGVTNTFSNQISGNGGFVKSGNGTTVFNNSYYTDSAHLYYGDTVISQGTLALDADWALSYRSNHFVAEGAILDLNNYSQETGMLTGYGTVDLGIGSSNQLWVGDYYHEDLATQSGDFHGSIIGEGNVYKSGYGEWSLHGTNTYEGNLFIEEGSVRLLGSLDNADVYNYSAFHGNGYVGGSLFNDGIISAGAHYGSPGTLTVGGNFTQSVDGTYFVQTASAKNHSRIEVGGAAEIDGAAVLVPVKGYQAKRNDKLTILRAQGGVDGRFSSFDSLLPETMLTAKLVYKADRVLIEFEQEKFAKLKGLTANEKSVARGLDKSTGQSSLNKLFDELNYLPVSEVPNALAQISPEQYAAIFNIGFASSQLQFNNIERRLDDVRNGARGFSSNGLALTNSRGTVNYDGMPIVNERDGLTLAGWDGKSVVSKQTVAPIISESRWSFFATGSGEWADVESTKNALGSEFTTGGVSIGADYRVSDNFVVGLTVNYTNTSSDLNDGGKIDVNSGRGAVYASLFGNGFYGNAVVGGGYNSYDLKRSTFGGKTNADTDGGQFDALLGGGYDYKVGGFTVGPIASLQYTYIGLSSFSENGSTAPLYFTSQNQDSLKSTLGLKASYAFNVGGVKITPEVRAQWLHEYLDSTAAIESSFAAGGSAFTVNGPNIGRDGILFDAGVSAQFNEAFSVFAYYTGDYGRTNYTSNSVNGGFRFSF